MGFIDYISKTYHRNLLEILLNKNKHLIHGKILDIGSKYRRYDYMFKGDITATDIVPKPEFSIIKADLINLDFEPNSFDSVICIEVFEYIEPHNFTKGFSEIHRVLRNDGKALISIPFFYKDHGDIMRVTIKYIKDLLKDLGTFNYTIIRYGNVYTSIYDSIRYQKDSQNTKKLKRHFINGILVAFYLFIKLFSLEKKQDDFYSGFFLILSKK